ncbi:hypothetical protein VNO77_02251 [Canavalia gladiata]|uniref:Secreted protein n=1 Tax=Canavalia gladiata TaxID=3824 RepID=A0AAN9MXL1_CANGL
MGRELRLHDPICLCFCWVLWAHRMAVGTKIIPFMGQPSHTLGDKFLLEKSTLSYVPMCFTAAYWVLCG